MSTDREIRRGQRDRMIAAHRQRRYASRMDGSEEGSDFGERALQLEGPFDPGIPQIGDAHEVEGRHAGRLVDLADERGLVADVAGAVARAWAIGDSEASSSTSTACPAIGGGIRHVADCLRAYLQRQDSRTDELIATAEKLDNGAVFKRLGFLAELEGKQDALAAACRARLSKGNAKLDPAVPCRKLVKRWRLWIPASYAEHHP